MLTRDLFVLHDDDGTFIDHTKAARDFLRDEFSVSFVSAEDKIYLGLYKPFYASYIELATPVAAGTGLTISAAYSNGSGFTAVEIGDDTNGFERNGFIQWDRELDDWEAQDVDGDSRFWLQLSVSGDFSATFDGINLVFSDDNDLLQEQRGIDDFRAAGDTSFIAYHVSSRNEIIQNLVNSGYATKVNGADKINGLAKWDLNRIGQIRQASKYLTLAKINFDVSSEVDDKYYQRWRDYMSEYQEAMRVYYLSLDSNDDGKEQVVENRFFRTVEITKV